MVALRIEKHLGFVHQAPEGFGVDDLVRIPLITGAHILLPYAFSTGTALTLIRKTSQRIEIFMFPAFQFLAYCHDIHSLCL
jgi:hypothetical protein